jgi:hypothetical protein
MQSHGFTECRPADPAPDVEAEPWLSLSSGYITRAADRLPRQGKTIPWRVHQNYALDLMAFRFGAVNDGVMRFAKAHRPDAAPQREFVPAREFAEA